MDENQSNQNNSFNQYGTEHQNFNNTVNNSTNPSFNNVNSSTSQSFKSASPTTTQASYKAFEGNSKKSKTSNAGFGKTVVLPFCMRSTWNSSCNWFLHYSTSY